MAKKSAKPWHAEPEEGPQAVPQDQPEGTPTASVSKADACRAALADGIVNAEEAIEFAKTRFGLDIKPSDFTLYKSKAKNKSVGAPKGKPGRKPKADSQAVEGYLAPPSKPQAVDGQPDLLAAMEAMKPLVASLGKDQVKRIVELLG